MHALRRCCDMQTCAKYAQPTSVTELELRRCSAFYAGTTPHASSQSCQRSLAAAAKSVDEYDAIEQHRRCSRRGEAGCRTRDQKVSCVALTRPREGRRGAREFWYLDGHNSQCVPLDRAREGRKRRWCASACVPRRVGRGESRAVIARRLVRLSLELTIVPVCLANSFI